jgi:hypothetical protein
MFLDYAALSFFIEPETWKSSIFFFKGGPLRNRLNWRSFTLFFIAVVIFFFNGADSEFHIFFSPVPIVNYIRYNRF